MLSKKIIFFACSFVLASVMLKPAAAQTYIMTDTTINYRIYGNTFIGQDGHGNNSSPRVNIVTNGVVVDGLAVYNSSVLNVYGGTVGLTVATDSSSVNITGGLFSGLSPEGNSNFTISGGSISNILPGANSKVTISGGSFASDLFASSNSVVTVSGGSFASYLLADGNSQITVSGGSFGTYTAQPNINTGINFLAYGYGSSINFIGSNLGSTNLGRDLNVDGTDYALSGTLADGTNLSGYILNVQRGATFNFQAVPEPSNWTVFATLITGAGILGLCRQTTRKSG